MSTNVMDPAWTKGQKVRLKADPSQVGETTGKTVPDGDDLLVQVRFPGKNPKYEVSDEIEVADESLDEERVLAEGLFARAASLRRLVTSVQLEGRLNELLYSLDTTNTEFMPHQFKPLLALLDSPSKGLLIADEVGLGKTIEAGLIWTELRFRISANRLLVICPAMLVHKWKAELALRFGTQARIMDAGELLEWLQNKPAQTQGAAIICSLQGIRPPTGWDDREQPNLTSAGRLARRFEEEQGNNLFDLTVIDEAHYLRNKETSSSKLGRLLRPVSDHLVLLSATPVNTKSDDLFSLVSLVDPEQFRYPHIFQQILEANLPLVQAGNALKRVNVPVKVIRTALMSASNHWLLRDSQSLKLLLADLAKFRDDETMEPEQRVEIGQRLERVNLLGQIIVRTRKRDVFSNRVQRKPARLAAVMGSEEKTLYRIVSEAISQYALSNVGVEGFLLAMPQRQMASCMYAAAKRWIGNDFQDDGEDDQQLMWESFNYAEVAESSPIVSHVARAVSGSVDLGALRREDSKFESFSKMLVEYLHEHADEKVLVFSYFRGTLDYLRERLDEIDVPSLVVKGGDDKYATIEQFRESLHHRVLLSSEVAAEGVDLQFMRLLVNYDLPWNPMRVEQRIGRIDRIGQKADAITIVNLVYADTIDERILVRLYERLQLFEASIGCTEEVLGDSITHLTKELMSARLTPEQELERIDQTRAAIEQRRRDQTLVEQNEVELIGLGDYVRDRVSDAKRAHRRITDADLESHVRDYLDLQGGGYSLRKDVADDKASWLKLPAAVSARLTDYRSSHRFTPSALENGEAKVIFRNHVIHESKGGRVELINQYHPLIRMIAEHKVIASQDVMLHAVTIAAEDIAGIVRPGIYVFSAEQWAFVGAHEDVSVRAAFIPLLGDASINGDAAFDALNALRSCGSDWVDAKVELPDAAELVNVLDRARVTLARGFRNANEAHQAENSDRVRLQSESLTRNAERRRLSLSQRLRNAELQGQKNLIQLTRGALKKLDEQTMISQARLESRRELKSDRSTLVEGFVKVRP